MSEMAGILADVQAAFNDVREFFADDQRVFLLRQREHNSGFTLVAELTTNYYVEFDDNRSESGLLRYATTDGSFRDSWARTTHVGYGVPDASDQVEVYGFADGEKDAIDPVGPSPMWSGRIVKGKKLRYTVAS